MHVKPFRQIAFILLLLLAPVGAWAADMTQLTVVTPTSRIKFTVELAETDEQQHKGLMFRESLPEQHGMIFDFGSPRHIDMWMKNTLISLDMIFIDNSGIITQISPNTVPESLDIIPSKKDTRAVLEVAAGTASRLHMIPGDKVIYPIFQ